MTGATTQSRLRWMLINGKEPAQKPWMQANPNARFEYALSPKTSQQTRDIEEADVHTMQELVRYVEQRMLVGDERYTRHVGGGRKADAASRAGYVYDTMVQAANIHMDVAGRDPYDIRTLLKKRVRDVGAHQAAAKAKATAKAASSGSAG